MKENPMLGKDGLTITSANHLAMLNKKKEVIPEGSTERGHQTIAKEKLFHHILQLIQESDSIDFFEIGKTTLIAVPKGFWRMPYRHWKFVLLEFRAEEGI